MFSPTQMGQIYLIFNQLPFLWDTSEAYYILKDKMKKEAYDSEYERYVDLENIPISPEGISSENYRFYDNRVKEDMQNAHRHAENLVEEFLRALKETAGKGVCGAWENMLPYIIGGVIVAFISVSLRACY